MSHVAVQETPCPHCGAELAEPRGDICGSCRGTLVVCGAFRIGSLIGRGSNGVVYAATSGGDEVAVKVRSLAGRGSWNAHERFERSARWLMGLTHPGLPRVHAFEPMGQGGHAWLALERFHGGTLHARVHDERSRLDDHSARTLLRGLLAALSALHEHAPPLVHRDVSPFTTVPPGATVYVGDREVPWTAERPLEKTLGTTPLTVDRGERRPLVLYRPGYRPFVVDLGVAEANCTFTARLTAE